MAPASTVLSQSVLGEEDDLFMALLAHLRRLYPKVYGTAVATGSAPECRDFQIEEGEGLSGGLAYIVVLN